jgi:hypothetical protein
MAGRLAWMAVAACFAGGAASAADRLCAGSAKADGHEVSVVLRSDARDRPILRAAYWKPPVTGAPADGAGPPALSIGYDLDGDTLGPVSSVGVLAWADLDPLPASASAWIQVGLDDGDRTWAVPWTMFADNVARIEDIRRDLKGYAVGGFAGAIPVATTPSAGRPGRNPALLSAVAAAQSATIAIVGNAGDEDLGHATADLAAAATRDTLFTQAYAQATTDPGKCTKAR